MDEKYIIRYLEDARLTGTHFRFTREDNKQLSTHFNSREFHCIGADRYISQYISKDLIQRLERVREKYKKPLLISSGFRTIEKQNYLRLQGFQTAKGVSQHCLGNAVDIMQPTDELIKLLREEFKAIGIGSTIVHVDTRDDKKREWTYLNA